MEHFYEELEKLRERRDRLAVYLMLYGGGLMLMASLPSRAFRLAGAYSFYAALIFGIVVMGLVGLWLIIAFLKNRREILDLKEDIEIAKATADEDKPKRGQRFAIGDDGELIPVEHEDPPPNHKRIRL